MGCPQRPLLHVLLPSIRGPDPMHSQGETYSLDDDEDMAIKEIQNLWIMEAAGHVNASCNFSGKILCC